MSAVPAGATVVGTLQRQAWIDRVLPPVEQVRPGLWSIPTPFPDNPLRYMLSYAVEYGGGIALVDTGWPCEEAWEGVKSGLAETGWSVGDINAVLITHGHGDHIGLARRIREQTGAWVAIQEADADKRAERDDHAVYWLSADVWLCRRGGLADDLEATRNSRPRTFEKYALAPDRFLIDGERPLGPGSDLVAIWTPGHTPGHVCFFDTARNLLLTGDHVLPRITPNISPSPFDTVDALGDYLGSLNALSGLAVQEVLPAHEYRFGGLRAQIAGIRGHHETRLGEIMAELHRRPGSTTVQVAAALGWSRPWEQMQGMQRRFAVSEAYAHLVHLDRTGYVANFGADVDAWHPLRDAGPKLA